MIRCTIELLPGGREDLKKTIGLVEIANIRNYVEGTADYAVVLKKTPPWRGALVGAWKTGKLKGVSVADGIEVGEDDEGVYAIASGHHRTKRGPYDLLFRALDACGLAGRNR